MGSAGRYKKMTEIVADAVAVAEAAVALAVAATVAKVADIAAEVLASWPKANRHRGRSAISGPHAGSMLPPRRFLACSVFNMHFDRNSRTRRCGTKN